ncbi:MAG: dihydrolipoyl dehydrogenase [Proteobacteria bacterium]|nr:dihydrolipoyl dehydrogenase [Pseudomonadota bacterium]
MNKQSFDLVVIGAGPGGYVAAIRASQLGLNVACVERGATLGGTCLNIGCIPSKALLESTERYRETTRDLAVHGIEIGSAKFNLETMMKRKEKIVTTMAKGITFLLKKNKVTHIKGIARIGVAGKVIVHGEETIEIEASKILIATGSRASHLPGVELDGDRIGTSTEALSYTEVPSRLVVIGAGAIGLELGSVWGRLGSKVTVVEYLDHILPEVDTEIAKLAQRTLKRQGIEFMLGVRVKVARVEGDKCRVEIEGSKAIEADRVLVAVGRSPQTEGLGLESAGIQTDKQGFIVVDDRFQTTAPNIYAIGDVIGQPMLAHKASDEAIACMEQIVTGTGHVNYDTIPCVVYTHPEVAQVGKTEQELKEKSIAYNKGTFSFRANGRAASLGQIDGMVKVLADKKTDRVLGVHILGPRAGDLIAEAAAAMEYGASSEDIAHTCHAHPTLSEAIKEAALDVDGRAIHA